MHGKMMKYLVVAGAALVVGMLVAGTPIRSALPLLLTLACPVMMIFMMRGMGGHNHGQAPSGDESTGRAPAGREATELEHGHRH